VDVFCEEPPLVDSPLLRHAGDRLILSPHVAGVSNEAASRIITMSAANVARVLKGEEPLHVINPL
jgi:phosphoglycerate dehydrogenase-like enzyme